jgi:hypothetical protein
MRSPFLTEDLPLILPGEVNKLSRRLWPLVGFVAGVVLLFVLNR